MPRWVGILVRTAAALPGGYGLASLVAAACAVALPLPRPDRVLAGTMAGIVAMACAALWVFAARTALRAWLGLLLPAAVLGLIVLAYRGTP